MKKLFSLSLLFLLVNSKLFSQNVFPNLSPHAYIKQEVGNTTIEINYDRPAARDRKIFGGLVPYGELWRTGAAYATNIVFDKAVIISGKKIPAGSYSLFTIPNRNNWEIILNSDHTLYGTYGYKEELDVLRMTVKRVASRHFYESLTIGLEFIPNNVELSIAWENTSVSFLIETETNKAVNTFIQESLFGQLETDAEPYVQGASYFLTYNRSLDSALVLTDYALKIEETEFLRSLRRQIFEKQGKKKEAKAEIEAALLFIRNNENYSEEDKKISTDEWNKYLESYP